MVVMPVDATQLDRFPVDGDKTVLELY
jgi:hypothetical protein